MRKHHVIAGLQGHEAGAGDEACHQPSFVERYACVVMTVQDQRRAADSWRELLDVDLGISAHHAACALRRRRELLQAVERIDFLGRAVGEEERGEHLTKRGIFAAPTKLDQLHHCVELFALTWPEPALENPARIRSVQHELFHAFGMARRVGDRDGTALRHAEKREAREARGICYCFEVADPVVERESRDIAIRQAATARIVAEERVVPGKLFQPRDPHGGRSVEFHVREPRADLQHGRSSAESRVGEPHAVAGGAETDVLFVPAHAGLDRGRRMRVRHRVPVRRLCLFSGGFPGRRRGGAHTRGAQSPSQGEVPRSAHSARGHRTRLEGRQCFSRNAATADSCAVRSEAQRRICSSACFKVRSPPA